MPPYVELLHLQIPLKTIVNATNNFSDENIIGQGGFGKVYKGNLFWQGQSIKIAAKRLDRSFGQGVVEFGTDISMRFSLDHKNVVSIIGFCDENYELIIISKHEANGSMDKYLSDPTLTWMQRLRICVDVANALSYLHYDVGRDFSLIHRNIKSSKILLDDNWEPKISGFNLCLTTSATRRNRIHLTDPCDFSLIHRTKTSIVTHKSDVYSFGVVLFEVLCGRKALNLDADDHHRLLSKFATSCYEEEKLDDSIDPALRKQMDPQSLKIFSETAYFCLKERQAERPNINQIVARLQTALELQLETENLVRILFLFYLCLFILYTFLLILKEYLISAPQVEGTSSAHQKWKNLEHLRIGLDDIKLATEDFAEKYHIGSGGYGIVYKAELEHFDYINYKEIEGENKCELPKRRSVVAIKRILNRQDKQGKQGFIAEIETLSSCKHHNVVSLLGFCDESREMLLVYEYAFNGSIYDFLRNIHHMTSFTWAKRLQMCLDIAEGLNYLHTKDVQRIIHRDIKSDNILLDQNFVAKIADFGLSKFGPPYQQVSYLLESNIAGTDFYLDPEYEKTGKLKTESDIYSFGVVLFELLSGKLAYDSSYTEENPKGLAPIAREHFIKGTLNEIVDSKLKEEVDEYIFTLCKGPNQDSLDTFSKVAYQCLAENQAQRPPMKMVIEELKKAIYLQENREDNLQISLQDIKLATQNFNPNNKIGDGRFRSVYKGEVVLSDGHTTIVAKRLDKKYGQGEVQFFTELEILFVYKHEHIIDLLGYCNEADEKIIVYEYAPKGSLDMHLKDVSLTWTKRLEICIDVANGVDFLHGGVVTQDVVIHRNIKSSNILLKDDWKAKISNFGLSVITPISQEIDLSKGFLTREYDIYSFGMVLFELLCGRMAYDHNDVSKYLSNLVMRHYEEENLDELVFEGIREQILPQSLITFQKIAYQCIHHDTKKRPTAKEVLVQLKKALEFQEDYEIWESKLPGDYREIFKLSQTPDIIYSTEKKKDLYAMLSKGILLQEGKVWFSLSNNGEKNEMISARMFSYENRSAHKWRSIKKSRFPIVVKMLNISNINIQIKIKPQFLSPNVIYGAHLVFKFCEPRKSSSQPMYVNLKYKMGSQTLHAYFAKWREDEWMTIELHRFLHYENDVDFEVILESFSRYYCGSGVIYLEGIEFRAIDDASLKINPEVSETLGEKRAVESNSGFVQHLKNDYNRRTEVKEGEDSGEARKRPKLFSLNKVKVSGIKRLMLSANVVLNDPCNMKCIRWKFLPESRFGDMAELLSHQVFRIKYKIKTQELSPNADYACYLVFKISEKCNGLQCPVSVRDVLLRKNKETNFIYLRSPSAVNLLDLKRIPKMRDDGLMEVFVWEFKSRLDDDIPMHLKLRCYEGTMCGLIVYGIEIRPI